MEKKKKFSDKKEEKKKATTASERVLAKKTDVTSAKPLALIAILLCSDRPLRR